MPLNYLLGRGTMQGQYLPSGTGDDSLDTPVDLNAARPVQHFAFGGIANPGGPVQKTAREMMDDVSGPEDDAALMRMLGEVESGSKMPRERILQMVEQVAQAGRGGDELLAYLSPESMAALKRMGGAGTINPATGLPEFKGGVLGRLFRRGSSRPELAPAPAPAVVPAPTPAPAPAPTPLPLSQAIEQMASRAPLSVVPEASPPAAAPAPAPSSSRTFLQRLRGSRASRPPAQPTVQSPVAQPSLPQSRPPVQPAPFDVSNTFVDTGRVPSPGGISVNPIALPTMGQPTMGQQPLSTPQPVARSNAMNPSNYFASQPAFQGITPGTISAPYNPLAMNQMPSPQALLYNNPNLSPQMLGGQQNAGMMTDRLGNRIYAPGTPAMGFAKGGEADINAMRALVDASNMAEDGDEVINTDPVGSAKSMLSDLMAGQEAPRSTARAPRLPSSGGGADRPKGMSAEYESLTTAKASKPKGAKSAQAELRALAKSYQLKKAAAENAARGLMSNTLGAPTLEKPTLEQGTLTTRRFAEGGEAKKGQEAEGSDGPSASALLRRLGLAVARGVPQAVTGLVDLAALPLTATGRMRAEDVVGTTDYLTKRGLLPKPQEGLVSESAELLSSMASPGGAAKAAVVGMIGPKGIIEAARRSKLFKGPGMTVPQEQFSSAQMLKMLEEQGIDTNRVWLRGKKEDSVKTFPQMDYDTMEYLYNYQKRPDAVEAAMRDSRRSQATQGRTLSHQPGDRSVTKFNTTGGVWLTESPSIAQTYTGSRGYVIPVYAPKPDVKLDAKGEQWNEFYRKDKDWKEAFADPKVRLVEVRNVIDAGPHWTDLISADASEEQLRALLTATNLFAKKPFEKRVVNKMTGEPFEFKHGGAVKHAA